MGEYADMLINGLLCESCHELIDEDEPGYPRLCEECGGDDEDDEDYYFGEVFDNEDGEDLMSKCERKLIDGVEYYLVPVQQENVALKVGKVYLSRNSEKIKIIADMSEINPQIEREDNFIGINIQTGDTQSYYKNGSYLFKEVDSQDLIVEIEL